MEGRAELVKTVKTGAGLYDAVVDVEYKGMKARVVVPRLVRSPSAVELHEAEGKLLLVFRDEKGGIASCCLEPSALEKGCLDVECPSAKVWVIPERHLEHSSSCE